MERTQKEIDEQVNECVDAIDSGRSDFPGMTYEQGVYDALRWVTGDDSIPPMGDDE